MSSTRVPSLSRKTARCLIAPSWPRRLPHWNYEDLWNHRARRLREDEENRLRHVGRVLQFFNVDVRKTFEQEGRAHAPGNQGSHLDVELAGLCVERVAKAQKAPLAGVIGGGVGPGPLGGRGHDVDDVAGALAFHRLQ